MTTTDDVVAASTLQTATFQAHVDVIAGAAQAATDAGNAKTAAEADAASIDGIHTTVAGQAGNITDTINDINAAIVPKIQYRNQLIGGGRFMDNAADEDSPYLTNAFSTNGLGGYNGATIVDGGKYAYNNSTYGGSAAEVDQTVIDLLTTMGRAGQRYGTSFRIAELTAGDGTYVLVDGLPQAVVSNGIDMSMYNDLSYACWVRLISGTAIVEDLAGLWIDGVSQPSNKALDVAENWVHAAGIYNRPLGYYTDYYPKIHASEGSVIQLAMPVLVAAAVQLPIHIQPLV